MMQLTLLQCSFLGYFLFLYMQWRGRHTALYPAVIVSSITVAGFFAGLLGVLRPAYHLMYAGGLALLPVSAVMLYRKRTQIDGFSLGSWLPALLMIICAFWLYPWAEGRFLFANDDFSHWGRIARVLAEYGRFPVDSDLLSHGTYPPGSALFIGYVSAAIGSTQGVWLFAQAIMMLAFWCALLDASDKLIGKLLLVCFVNWLMRFNHTPETLWVDNLLGAAAFAACMLCVDPRDVLRSGWCVLAWAAVLCAVVLIKSSGLLFAVIIAGYCLIGAMWREKRLRKRYCIVLLPFAVLLMWNVYCKCTFTTVMSHQVSVDYYQQILGGKSAEDIVYILKLMLSKMGSPQTNLCLWLLIGFGLTGILQIGQGKSRRMGLGLPAALFVLYELGILLMYILSMSMSEIHYQQGNDYFRYNNTLTALLAGLLLTQVCSLKLPRIAWKQALPIVGIGAVILANGTLTWYVLEQSVRDVRSVEERIEKAPMEYAFAQMEEKLAEIPQHSSYVVLFPEAGEEYFLKNLSRYYLRSKDIVYCYTRAEAEQACEAEVWRYFVDLENRSIRVPEETVGVELFTDTGAAAFTNVLDSVGYKENTRYSTSNASDVTAYGWDVTGYLPVKAGDVIRLRGVAWYPTEENGGYGSLYWFAKDRSFKSNNQLISHERLNGWQPVYDDSGNIVEITVSQDVGSAAYLRFSCQNIDQNSVITINEMIP